MGKILAISDVHSNLEALIKVLDHAGPASDYDQIACLGDIVGYGPNPNECIGRLIEYGFNSENAVLGNHDRVVVEVCDLSEMYGDVVFDVKTEFGPRDYVVFGDFHNSARLAAIWNAGQLMPKSIEFLRGLRPKPKYKDGFGFVHGTFASELTDGRHEDVYVREIELFEGSGEFDRSEIEKAMISMRESLGFAGHTHMQGYMFGLVKEMVYNWMEQSKGFCDLPGMYYSPFVPNISIETRYANPELVGVEYDLAQIDEGYHPKLIVNPGSVGQPRDSCIAGHSPHISPEAKYCVVEYDDNKVKVLFRAVEYDANKTRDKILQTEGLPENSGRRLLKGR